MDAYTQQFYDLLYRAFNGDTSSKRLQDFVDTMFADKYNVLQLDGFSFDDMQLDLTYEQVQRELGLTAMANYYDLDSPAIPRGTEEVSLVTGKIPRLKDVEYMNEDKLRKQLILERMNGVNSVAARDGALKTLFVTIDSLVGGIANSFTYQRHQMVSAGKLTLTDKNNPKGIKNVTFSAHIPSGNITKLSGDAKFWTDKTYATEGASADPIASIIDWLTPILDKGITGHVEVNHNYLRKILNHKAVLKSIGLSMFPISNEGAAAAAAAQSAATRQSKFEELIGVPVKVIDSLVAVESYDKSAKKFVKTNVNAFEPDVLVFVPDGSIGKMVTAMPLTFETSAATYSTFYDGRVLLTVAADAVKKCQSYNIETTTLAVPEVPQYMFYLYPNEA
ncbi:MAG: major capsid protein [Fastidiosipilaceae bacterium]|jgi:hypothetical protein